MQMRKYTVLALVAGLTIVSDAYAQSRGGSCRAPICNVIGLGVFLLLAGFFSLSVYDNIKRNGITKGLFGHPGVQAILMFVGMVSIAVGVPAIIFHLFGKSAAIWSLIFMMAALVWYARSSSNRPSRHHDTEA